MKFLRAFPGLVVIIIGIAWCLVSCEQVRDEKIFQVEAFDPPIAEMSAREAVAKEAYSVYCLREEVRCQESKSNYKIDRTTGDVVVDHEANRLRGLAQDATKAIFALQNRRHNVRVSFGSREVDYALIIVVLCIPLGLGIRSMATNFPKKKPVEPEIISNTELEDKTQQLATLDEEIQTLQVRRTKMAEELALLEASQAGGYRSSSTVKRYPMANTTPLNIFPKPGPGEDRLG